jgi:hypothetical protein
MSGTQTVRKWFKEGTRKHFLSVPVGDRWIARKANGDVGTFHGAGDVHYDTVVPSGTDWHTVRDEEAVSVLSGMLFWCSVRRLRS